MERERNKGVGSMSRGISLTGQKYSRKKIYNQKNYKHTKEYRTWRSIRQRCYSLNNKDYHNYGGRGIIVCDRWLELRVGFFNFLEDMGYAPGPEYSIDRIDNDGPYSPENCRWATKKEQNRNSRNNNLIKFGNSLICLTELAENFGINYSLLYFRLKMNWPLLLALSAPKNTRLRTVLKSIL